MSENIPNNDLFCAIGNDSGNNDENHGIDMAIAKYLDGFIKLIVIGLSYYLLDRKFSGIFEPKLPPFSGFKEVLLRVTMLPATLNTCSLFELAAGTAKTTLAK